MDGTVVESIGTGPGRYDHVIVGPRGVYLLESRQFGGVTRIPPGATGRADDELPAAERRPIEALRRRLPADAAGVSAELRRRTGRSTWVTPVVVVWSDFPQGVVETDHLAYVHGSRFGPWLAARPACLDPAAVAEIGAALTALRRDRDARFSKQRPERPTDGPPRPRPPAPASGTRRPHAAG
jgi:hypothetical protein